MQQLKIGSNTRQLGVSKISITLGNGDPYYEGQDYFQSILGQNGNDFLGEIGSFNYLDGGNGNDMSWQ